MDSAANLPDGDGSSSDLDISNDINGCIKSLDDDIEGPAIEPTADTQSSTSSSSNSSSSSEDSSSSTSKTSKTSSSHKKEKPPEPKVIAPLPPPPPTVIVTTDRVLYPARLHKQKPSTNEKSHKVQQHRSRSRSRVPRAGRESGYRTDGSATSDRSNRRRKSRAPSAPRSNAPIDLDLDLNVLQLSTEPSTSIKLTKRNVNLMARKNDTNNNTNSNKGSSSSKVRPMALNLELNRRLLEHKMDLNGRTGNSTPFSAYKLGFQGFKSSQSFQELTATSRVMAPWKDAEAGPPRPVKYAKSLPRTIKSRRSSVASRAGSVRSATSTISRLRRAPTPAAIKNNEYVTAQVADITAALARCTISSARTQKASKFASKATAAAATANASQHANAAKKKKTNVNKRRNKKNNNNNDASPAAEDHKLPLKKRHYLIAEEKTHNSASSASPKRKRLKKAAPPGIFEPTEQPEHEEAPPFEVSSFNLNVCPQMPPAEAKPLSKSVSVVDNILTKMDPTVTKRKRRRANRTGFPTPKRPKKKQPSDNASDTSSVVRKRTKKPKINVPNDEEDDQPLAMVQSLTIRQLQLKQLKELEPKVNSSDSRVMRGRAKSVCHVAESEALVVPLPKQRKRRQTLFVENKEELQALGKKTEPLVASIETKPVKKRRQTVFVDAPTKKSRVETNGNKKQADPAQEHPVKLIPKNVYNGDTQKRAFNASLMGTKCICAPNPCGESCLNRSICIECDVAICGKSCTNAVIQTGGLMVKDVEKFMTERKGFGVRTKKDIVKKTLILEYTGEVLYLETFRQRMQTIYKNDHHHYCLELSGGLVIDGHRMGSLCRFVNHSCKPNCSMAKIYVEGLPRMILQAEEDISAGTELTYDYKFDNFEDMTPQQCFCGAENCRGTLSAQIKTPRRSSLSLREGETTVKKGGRKGRTTSANVKSNSCFLLRNLRRVEKYHPELMAHYRNVQSQLEDDPKADFSFVSKTHESSPPALEKVPEIVKKEEEPPEPEVVQQALSEQSQVLWQICERLQAAHGTQLERLIIPAAPEVGHSNHDRISHSISFEKIKAEVKKANYDLNPTLFNHHVKILLDNVAKFWGVNCEQFQLMLEIRDGYRAIRNEMIEEIKRVWGDGLMVNAMLDKVVKKPAKNRKKTPEKNDEEDVVNCHCGRYLEEGLMIQCQKCLTWQHVECTETDGKAEDYSCAKCEGHPVTLELVKKDETTADGHQCYLTLMRGDLQLRVGDAVYVLRDIPIDPAVAESPRHTYETIGAVNYTECDIVRVETLYKDEKGEARVLGHHYLRPNEVYHEPSRKFYTNELMRTSIFESIPINLVIDTCWVLDPTSYFKGRPINSREHHVYICEFKVDKQARIFSVIKKSSRQPISIKPYAFYRFEELLRQKRNHVPHDIDHVIPKKTKKDLQQPKKDKRAELANSNLPLLPKDMRSALPRKVLTKTEKMEKLEVCLLKLKPPAPPAADSVKLDHPPKEKKKRGKKIKS